jgi:cysteine protease ATG4
MDPSMLIGFLIQNEDDWIDWKQRVSSSENIIIHIYNGGPELENRHERQEALDEVEALDDSSGCE